MVGILFDGVQMGPVKKVSSKELRLEPLPAPPAPLRLAPWCVNCGGPAMLRCMACGSSICGRECATERWKHHRPECRRLQAVAFGEEYARNEERSYCLAAAAHFGDVGAIRRLSTDLSAAVLSRSRIQCGLDAIGNSFIWCGLDAIGNSLASQ